MPSINGMPVMPSLPIMPTSSVRRLSTAVSKDTRQSIGK